MRMRPTVRGLGLLCLLLGALALGAAAPAAQASRVLLSKQAVNPAGAESEVPEKQIEGACGVAVNTGAIYVSDYYHHAVDVFGEGTRIVVDPLQQHGPCGLAFDASNNLYVNFWHRSVVKFKPPYAFAGGQTFDAGESTGVAVDRGSGRVYVDDRTYVAVYEPSGDPVTVEGQPLRIGRGPLADTIGDGYGVAVAGGRVFVPDAGDDTIKVFEPAVDLVDPVAVIDGLATPQGGFSSLVDAAIAFDPKSNHLLVVDNLQPGFAHPKAAIDEFDLSGEFLGQLATPVVDGEPSGVAVEGDGTLYVTSGNDENANVFEFGAYVPGSLSGTASGGGGEAAQPSLAVGGSLAAAASSSLPARAAQGDPPPPVASLRLLGRPVVAGATAEIRARTDSPGVVSVAGEGLRPLRERRVGAGGVVLRLRLSRAGRRALAKAKSGRLAVKARIAFSPDRGRASTAARVVVFAAVRGRRG
jgi:hypothetical protein